MFTTLKRMIEKRSTSRKFSWKTAVFIKDSLWRIHHFAKYSLNIITKQSTHTKIFGIGLAKTGTSSLAHALKILGFRTHHYSENILKDMAIHDALCDMPIQTRYKEYDKKYPNSKFILTIRDREPWLLSCEKWWALEFSSLYDLQDPLFKYREEQFGCYFFDKAIFEKVYDQHIKDVTEYFKERPNDLLILNICGGDGWAKLCTFLNKDIPSISFPKKNRNSKKKAA
ncbi:hypothetical protein H0W32_03240 [Patescibacteria group bacterium]|nr:hypothetical protein [Patescibacteria group bacterium]